MFANNYISFYHFRIVLFVCITAGVSALLSQKVVDIEVEDLECAQSAAEGANLSIHRFQEYRSTEKRKPEGKVRLADGANDKVGWNLGSSLAKSQNWARVLAETPANLMTPTIFAQNVTKHLSDRVKIEAHGYDWCVQEKMGSFLSVARGSEEPPVFLELTYNGNPNKVDDPYVCLVGKGITFDSGGISLKPSANMDAMRADMGGAAAVVATIDALANNKVPINVKALVPLAENLPSGRATKPGDVVIAANGKSICVDNTDAEGRLVLADALCYSSKFNPKYVIDVATLTGAMRIALGDCTTGAFCNNNRLWNLLQAASTETGDRVWRMPLFKHYSKQMTGKLYSKINFHIVDECATTKNILKISFYFRFRRL